MGSRYRYMNRWNTMLLRPIGDEPYLSEDEARDRYATPETFFEFIPEPDPTTGVPAWSAHVYNGTGAFGVEHYNRHGSLIRLNGFHMYDGRLLHDERIDYLLPDTPTRLTRSDATRIDKIYIEPDGLAKVTTRDKVRNRHTTLTAHWTTPTTAPHVEITCHHNDTVLGHATLDAQSIDALNHLRQLMETMRKAAIPTLTMTLEVTGNYEFHTPTR